MQEEWKEVWIDGRFSGRLVSNLGRLKLTDGTIQNLYDNGAGYLSARVGLKLSKKTGKNNNHFIYIHRLVAMYFFLPNPFSYPQVNHKDCDKSNNRVDNLEWISNRANINHAHASGRMIKRTTEADIEILTIEQVIDLYTSVKRDKLGISFTARRMGIPRTTASSIINKRSRGSITDKIDEYLENEDVIHDRMLTGEDIGLESCKNKTIISTEVTGSIYRSPQ